MKISNGVNFKEIFKPGHFNKLLAVLTAAVVLVFVFTLGVFVGHEKARFSRDWGENYYRNIVGPGPGGPAGLMMGLGRPGFSAHNGLGQIIKIDGDSLLIRDQSNLEKTILITNQTAIVEDHQNIMAGDLKVDDKIIIIGRPNDRGQIEPKLIRVLPVMPPFQPN